MNRIAILTPSITTGDAVSNDVLGMYELLKRHGHETRIYAEGWTLTEPKIRSVLKIKSFLKSPDDLLIYHYSRGWDLGLELLRTLRCRTAVRYHNVTPPEFFEGINRDLASMCLEGRKQLTSIAGAGCDLYISASGYNEQELLQGGVAKQKSFVVPPFHHIDHLESISADPGVLDAYDDGKTNVLMVGRVSPNKNHASLIQAFAAYYHDYNANSRLFIVGKEETRLNSYNRWIHQIAAFLKVQDAVVFTGEVSERALKAYYSLAHVFLTTSEHEGFCVPLVEAMSMKVPIVAYGSTAIPGTVGDAGLVWSERDPYLLAQSIESITRDASVSEGLGAVGWRRYQRLFTNERIKSQFMGAIAQVL